MTDKTIDDVMFVHDFEKHITLPWYKFYKKLWWQILYCKLKKHDLVFKNFNLRFDLKTNEHDWQRQHKIIKLRTCKCCGYIPFQRLSIDVSNHHESYITRLSLVKEKDLC